jgi:hypothetical protein
LVPQVQGCGQETIVVNGDSCRFSFPVKEVIRQNIVHLSEIPNINCMQLATSIGDTNINLVAILEMHFHEVTPILKLSCTYSNSIFSVEQAVDFLDRVGTLDLSNTVFDSVIVPSKEQDSSFVSWMSSSLLSSTSSNTEEQDVKIIGKYQGQLSQYKYYVNKAKDMCVNLFNTKENWLVQVQIGDVIRHMRYGKVRP